MDIAASGDASELVHFSILSVRCLINFRDGQQAGQEVAKEGPEGGWVSGLQRKG